MPNLRFTYFDIKSSRGQVARLAFDLAGLPFEDVRLSFADFIAKKSEFPFGAIPILEVDGQTISQSNGINRYVGRLTDLYPEDALQAALCDEVMSGVEDAIVKLQPTMFIKDEAEKKAARTVLAETVFPANLRSLATILKQRGEYFAAGRLTVADLKVFVWVKDLNAGRLDHIPTDLVKTNAPELMEHFDRVWSNPTISAHYE